MTSDMRNVDVAVIGAGLAGTCAASVLAKAGYATALIDPRGVYPHDFRAEKLGQPQMDQFERLGVGASAASVTTPVDEVTVVRFGTLIRRERRREYGISYTNLVNRLRADLPGGSALTVGRIDDILPGGDRRTVVLADGRRISARLVVVATGLGDAVRRKVGISRTSISPRHSLSIGFDMRAPRRDFPFQSLTYYAESFGMAAAYLTLFPLGDTMRANLFAYREPGEAWTRAFGSAPSEGLAALLPRLRRLCPDLAVAGAVEVRPIDLVRAEDPARDGVVLIGDAYLNTCPIPGTGIGKVLVDVERLCRVYVPRWMDLPNIDRAATADFYADPVKAASDAESLRASVYARAIGTATGLPWKARRLRNYVGRHVIDALCPAR